MLKNVKKKEERKDAPLEVKTEDKRVAQPPTFRVLSEIPKQRSTTSFRSDFGKNLLNEAAVSF
jgi:hypothetical protein